MNLKFYLDMRAHNGIALLKEFGQILEETTVEQFATDFGYRVYEVKKIRRAWRTFKAAALSRAADETKLSFTTLMDLSSIVYPLRHRDNRRALLVKLCHLIAGKDPDTAKNLARRQVNSWTEETSHCAPDTARCHRTIGRDGKRRLTAAFSEHKAAHINTILDGRAKKLIEQAGGSKYLAYDRALAQALYDAITGTTAAAPAPKFGPMFMIATDLSFHTDGRIATTDGALMELKDVLEEELAPTGYAAVIAKNVDTGRREVATFVQVERTWPNDPNDRFAGDELRLKAVMETLVCTWPGCSVAASTCQIHHIQSVKRGGKTIGENSTPLCSHHNGINDDNPLRTKNGRIERDPVTGRAGLKRTPESELEFNQNPVTEKTTRAYIDHIYG